MADFYSDESKLNDLYARAKTRSQAERYGYERDWFRNVLFLNGLQWVYWNVSSRRWQPRIMKKWIPRPVTNKFASVAMSIVQVISAKSPSLTFRPGSEQEIEDQATAMIANRAWDVLSREAGIEEARQMIAAWCTLTGNAIAHPCYDPDSKEKIFIQQQQCPECKKLYAPDQLKQTRGTCPACGSETIPATDETGEPIGEQFARGKLRLEIFSPFEVYCDMEARSFQEVHELMVRRRYQIEYARQRWPQPAGEAIQPDMPTSEGSTGSLNYLRAIAYAAGTGSHGGYSAAKSAGEDQGVTVDFLWRKPNDEFPAGLVSVWANGKMITEGGEDNLRIPYVDRQGKPIWPFHHFLFDKVPGRLWGRTPLDDVAPKQEQRNRIEALIELIIMRSANPVWLKPKNSGVGIITGEPGQEIDYNFVGGANIKPERIPGENVPSSVMMWLEKIDSDIEDLAGVFEVLKGNAPSGVSAGTALRLLLERAVTRFSPIVSDHENKWALTATDLLTIFQQYGTEKRTARISGAGNTWEVMSFSNADLRGAVDAIAEAGSSFPKNTVGTQALIQDLATMGVINPLDPETRYEILKDFGATRFMGSTDDDVRHAQRENWFFINQDKPMTINKILDNNMVHFIEHKKVALTSDFDSWPPQKRAAFLFHLALHQAEIVMSQMAMASPSGPSTGLPTGPRKPASSAGPEGKPPEKNGRPGLPPDSEIEQDNSMPPAFPGLGG